MTVLFFLAVAAVLAAVIYGFVKRTPVKKIEATYSPSEAPTQVGSDPVLLDQPEQEKPVLLSDEDLWPLVPTPDVPVAEPAKEDPVTVVVEPEPQVNEEKKEVKVEQKEEAKTKEAVKPKKELVVSKEKKSNKPTKNKS